MGALASGDRWFGGRTRNPWNTEQGSSGSSAGPGSSTAAGLVGFSIGTETRGSIMSPSTRNGVTGLRPTFGRVSRYGAMALSWSMDKIGPMCRAAEDCALVFSAIQGPDGRDNTVLDVPFNWDATADVTRLRVGYLRSSFEDDIEDDPENPQRVARQRQNLANDQAALEAIRGLGVQVAPFDLPDLPVQAVGFILGTEAAAAFDMPTLNAQLDSMRAAPEESRWPDSLRTSRFVPAVEYLQAQRVRMRIIEEVHEALGDFDLFIGSNLALTNLTGHPEISMPNGFFQGSPTSLRFTGKLFGEAEILLLAHAYQAATDHHLQHPTL
jgi:Asp-tRNA(Asn)/Glu-tRNA(Gln) amidotransferase A subunit family amidase